MALDYHTVHLPGAGVHRHAMKCLSNFENPPYHGLSEEMDPFCSTVSHEMSS